MDTFAISTLLEQVGEIVIEPGVDRGRWPLTLRQTRAAPPGRVHMDLAERIPRCALCSGRLLANTSYPYPPFE